MDLENDTAGRTRRQRAVVWADNKDHITAPTLHEALSRACADVGVVSRDVPADGQWHKTDIDGDPRGRGDGRIKLFADGEGGIVCNWKGETRPFFVDDGRKLTEAERRDRERKRADAIRLAREEEARRHAEAREKAAAIWKAASPAPDDHPYLARKRVSSVATLREIDAAAAAATLGYAPKCRGEPLAGRLLVVPIKKVGGELSTVELIDASGRKAALAGGAKAGGFWAAQPLPDGGAPAEPNLLVGEGVATVLSAKVASGIPGVAVLSCGNLEPVARAMRERFPEARLVILADLDKKTGLPNPRAIEAARAIGGLLAVPDFGEARPEGATDFNDLALHRSWKAVQSAIANAKASPGGEPKPSDGAAPVGVNGDWPEPEPLTGEVAPEPYPLDALPETIRAAVEEVQGFTKAPVPLVASSALAALSIAAQAYIDVRRADKLEGPSSLFLLTIADSGERKTTCDGFFTKVIREYEAEEAGLAKEILKEYDAKLRGWTAESDGLMAAIRTSVKAGKEGMASAFKQKLVDLEKHKPEPPRVPKLLRMDDTPESLAWFLAKEWPSVGVVCSEGGIIFGAHAMGKDSIMRNLGLLNVLWDGGLLRVGRRTSESFTVRGARLTVGLQIQEATLRSFFDRSGGLARGTGFLARFLVAWPQSTQGYRPFTEPPPAWPAQASFNRRIAAILASPVPMDDDGTLSPAALTLAPAAKAAWVEFHDAIEDELRNGGELYDVRDVASKTADNAARLAALFQVFERDAGGAVGLEAFEGASRIVAWHLNESRRFFGELALPAELADAARLDRWLIEYCRRERTRLVGKNHTRQYGPLRGGAVLGAAIRELAELDRVRLVPDGKRLTIHVNPALVTGEGG